MVITKTVSASDRKITDITKSNLRTVYIPRSSVVQVIYKAFQFSGVFLIFQEQQRQAAYT
ncbi:MAG: hypothetical protein HWQ38_28430 [Nostoc sp. NMS7]|uniref:hypothetical protein n=1 Tax=unclassified Nostoc TaxID=2593658 RepID=UPI0025E1E31F|nr:hypothetical protein [Nostoc sp. NMS7]MBN3950183.1 hypothetical protein [Nostoc sp. NMS7]